MTSDKAWRTEGGRRSDMVREERQENGNPRCKSVRCALAEERGPEGEVRWMLWSEGTSRKQTKTESLKEASTPFMPWLAFHVGPSIRQATECQGCVCSRDEIYPWVNK